MFREPEHLASAIHGATIDPCQLSRKAAQSTVTRIQCPRLCLDLVNAGPAMLYAGEMPRDCYTLSFVSSCPGTGRSFNFGTEFHSGHMGVFTPAATLDAYNPANCANALLTVPAAEFHSILETRFPEISARMLKQDSALLVGLDEQAELNRLLASLQQAVWDEGDIMSGNSPCQIADDLLDRFLEAMRSGYTTPLRTPGPRVTHRHQRFRRARDYLEAHRNEPVRLHDLCEETGLSQRGVENLFHDFVGVGPNAFLKLRRLHGARRKLRKTPRAHGAVKRVAYESGFWHLGRFAQEYSAFFGESPSASLASQTSFPIAG